MHVLILAILLLASANSYAEDLLLGFFDGLGANVDLSLIKDCTKNLDPVVAQIMDVINDIQHLDIENIYPLVSKIVSIAFSIYVEVKPCISGSQELIDLFEKIKSFDINNKLPYIISHSFSIIALALDVQKQANAGNPYKLGKDIGSLISLICLQDSVKDSDPIVYFLTGFFSAFGQSFNISQIMGCLTNADQLWADIISALNVIKLTNWKSASAIIAALLEVEKVVKELIADLKGCSTTIPELDVLLKSIEKINITSIVPEILMNFARIQNDIKAIQTNYASSNWTGVGYYIGDIFAIFIVKPTALRAATPIAFVTGLLEGLQVSVDVSNLLSCLQNAEYIIQDIQDAMNKLKKIDFSHIVTIVEGLKELVNSVEDLLSKITPCVNSPTDIENIIAQLKNINWGGVPKKIISNLGEVIEDAALINSGFNDGDYEGAGKAVGDLIRVVLL